MFLCVEFEVHVGFPDEVERIWGYEYMWSYQHLGAQGHE